MQRYGMTVPLSGPLHTQREQFEELVDLGYTDVVSMAGGFGKWKNENRPWSAPRRLSPEQINDVAAYFASLPGPAAALSEAQAAEGDAP